MATTAPGADGLLRQTGRPRPRYGPPEAPGSPEPRHINGTTTGLILAYVRDRLGDAGVREVLDGAGEERSVEDLSDPTAWSSYDQAIALFEAAAAATGDPRVGRGIGEELLRRYRGTPVETVLRALGSPGEVLRNIASTTSKFAAVSTMEAVEITGSHGLVSARSLPGFVRHPIFCDYVAGQLSQVSVLFGMPPAAVTEEECQTQGDDRCLYRVVWSSRPDDPDQKIRYLEAQVSDLAARFHALQAAAAELVSAEDLDVVLSRIAILAGRTVRAQRYLLVVHPEAGGPMSIHHSGLGAAEAAALATEVLEAHDLADDLGRLVVDVRSARRYYGRLVALGPEGTAFFPTERALLESYAGLAAAALDTTTAMLEIRQREATTASLLHLARALATLADPEQVCQRAARLIPGLVGADKAAMFRWDPEERQMCLGALEGWPPEFIESTAGLRISGSDTPEVDSRLGRAGPRFYRLSHLDDPFLAPLLSFFSVEACLGVPITGAGGELYGVILAAWTQAPEAEPGPEAVGRLEAVADHVSAALQNAGLIQQVRHQALHDPLTGLPNQTLFRDRAEGALARARRRCSQVALLFVDLDRFKDVNDRLGHLAGDDLLRVVAERLVSTLRVPDSVGRLGGDEFLVLIEDAAEPSAAGAVAAKLSRALHGPFEVQGEPVPTSASIGVAVYPLDGQDFETLLRHADAAMYEAKRAGRNGWARYGDATP